MQQTILLLLLPLLVTSYGSDALLRIVITEQWEKPKFSEPVALRLSEDDYLAFGSVTMVCHRCITTYSNDTMLGFSVTKIETMHALVFASEDGGCSWETVIDAPKTNTTSETHPRPPLFACLDPATCYPQSIDWIPEWLEIDEEEEMPNMPPKDGGFS